MFTVSRGVLKRAGNADMSHFSVLLTNTTNRVLEYGRELYRIILKLIFAFMRFYNLVVITPSQNALRHQNAILVSYLEHPKAWNHKKSTTAISMIEKSWTGVQNPLLNSPLPISLFKWKKSFEEKITKWNISFKYITHFLMIDSIYFYVNTIK